MGTEARGGELKGYVPGTAIKTKNSSQEKHETEALEASLGRGEPFRAERVRELSLKPIQLHKVIATLYTVLPRSPG